MLSTVFFAGALTFRRRWKEVLVREAWFDIAVATVIIGFVYYGLQFAGAKFTTAGNIGIVNAMETLFSFLILSVLLKHEHLDWTHLGGALLMVLGVVIIFIPQLSGVHTGDLMVLLATAIVPFGNRFAKRARSKVHGECIYFYRSAFSGAFLLALAYFIEPLPTALSLRDALWLMALNGILLLGFSKLLWMEGMHRLTIAKAVSLGNISPVFTLIFAYLFLNEQITLFQVLALVPILLGVRLLTITRT